VTHFLLTPAARSLSIAQVLRLSDEEAFDTLKRVRFGRMTASRSARIAALQRLHAGRDADPLEVLRLRAEVLRHVGNHLPLPQAVDPRLPRGDRAVLQRREGRGSARVPILY
jgi:hypothetical protein